MREVAIVGAGELGGLVAHALARRDVVRTVRLIDPDQGRVADGKALDIAQAAPVEQFSTDVLASSDLSTAAGAGVIVLADRAGSQPPSDDDRVALVRRIRAFAPRVPLVCAGAPDRRLVERARELGIARTGILGSAAEALNAAARALVALELNASPADVSLSVLGVPPSHIVVAWEDASIGGFAATRLLAEPARRRLTERITALWPPGPYALAAAAAKVVQAMAGGSRRFVCCFVAPDASSGLRTRSAALPVRVGSLGIVDVLLPELGPGERVALDNAMLL